MKKIILFLAYFSIVFADNCSLDYIRETINYINKDAPMQIDKATILQSTTCVNDKFLYLYQLIDTKNLKWKNFTKEQRKTIYKKLKDKNKNFYCTHPKMELFRDILSGMIWNYMLEDGSFYYRIEVDKTDCYKN